MHDSIKKMCLASMFLALAIVLPFLTGQIQSLGQMFSPMHIPVLLCGFICGPFYGLIVGIAAPFIRFLFFGMPPLFPTGIAMAFELGCYGFLTGLLFNLFKKKLKHPFPTILLCLLISMILGRLINGGVTYLLLLGGGKTYSFSQFIKAVLLLSWPGIILQLVLIPIILTILIKARLLEFSPESSLDDSN